MRAAPYAARRPEEVPSKPKARTRSRQRAAAGAPVAVPAGVLGLPPWQHLARIEKDLSTCWEDESRRRTSAQSSSDAGLNAAVISDICSEQIPRGEKAFREKGSGVSVHERSIELGRFVTAHLQRCGWNRQDGFVGRRSLSIII